MAYFGPQAKKLLTVVNVHPNGIFSGNYISILRGCCATKFLYALVIDQRYLAHTPTGSGGRGSPLKNFNRENSKSGLKFSLLDSITSGLVEVSSRDFYQSTPRQAGVIKWHNFYNARPQNFVTAKKIDQNFSRFLTTFDFDREYLRKESTYQKSEKLLIIYNPSHVRPRKFGVLWSTNEKVIDSNKCTP